MIVQSTVLAVRTPDRDSELPLPLVRSRRVTERAVWVAVAGAVNRIGANRPLLLGQRPGVRSRARRATRWPRNRPG